MARAQSKRAVTVALEELIRGLLGADGATVTSSTLTHPPGAEPTDTVTVSPAATRTPGTVYWA
ncbi:hypothetical protein ACFQ0M_12225 [Kitasatospora aburaviensis]